MNEKLIQRTDPKYDEDVVNKRYLDKMLGNVDFGNVVESSNDTIDNIIALTQAEYNALVVKDEKTIYNITDSIDIRLGNDIPIGSILPYPSNTPPTNWLIADGSAVSRNTYNDLFGVIGTTYGVGDGSTTFNLPNLKGRIPVGRDTSQTEFDIIGETGGNKLLQSHNHMGRIYSNNYNNGVTIPAYRAFAWTYNPTRTVGQWSFSGGSTVVNSEINETIETANTGGGNSQNLQPYMVQNYIIFAQKITSIVPTNALVINNLTSTSTTDALSANMGRTLNNKIRQQIFGSSLSALVPSGTVRFVGTHLASEAYSSAFVFPTSGTIRNLKVYTGGAPGAGQVYYFDMFKDNVQQAITCSISTVTNFTSDTTNSFTVNANQRVSLRCSFTVTAATTTVQYGFEFIPD